MLKRTIASQHVVEYIDAMFKDIEFLYERRTQWARDKSRVLHELEHHGLRTLTIDFPGLCKHFDKCLDEGQYTSSSLPFGRPSKGMVVPAFLRDLHLLIFDKTGCLRPDPDETAVYAIRVVYLGMAKVGLACSQGRVDDEVRKFLEIEGALISPTLDWTLDVLNIDDCTYGHISGDHRFCARRLQQDAKWSRSESDGQLELDFF